MGQKYTKIQPSASLECDHSAERGDYTTIDEPQGLHRILKEYFRYPLLVLKDFILLSLAIPGLFTILNPVFICDQDGRMIRKDHIANTGQVPPGICNCGNTVAEAIEMGCKYDPLASAWLPPHCLDEQLSDEFEKSGDGPNGEWKYWRDGNLSQEISLEELQTKGGDEDFHWFSSSEWHILHCLFYWRKQFRARYNHVTVEPRYDTEDHIIHCIAMITTWDGAVGASVALDSDVQ
ncbi:hypothetical protein F5884DRAFT_788559 [Xylogone sp. PMI_703]|nr:hypothetical protein F5884DRAFT_788559 [Xylogone sp. PMI_703]